MTPPTLTPPKSSGLAVTSAVLGFLSLLTGFLTGIPAVIMGHLAHGKIRRSGGTLGGAGWATTGLVMGYIMTAMSLVVALVTALAYPQIQRALDRSDMAMNINNAKQIKLVLDSYAMDNDGAYPPDLDTLKAEQLYGTDLDALRYGERNDAFSSDWIYHGGYENVSRPDTIILASPVTLELGSNTKRIVCTIDSAVRPIPETEYQQRIRDQLAPERE